MIQFDGIRSTTCKYWNGRSVVGQCTFLYDVRDDVWKGLGVCNGWIEYAEGRTLDDAIEKFKKIAYMRECEV